MDLTITVIVTWIFATCLHEFGHAITAYVGGDKSVKDRGYLTLNPIVYFNSATTLVLPLIILLIGGIAFPGAAVYINNAKLKNRVWQSLVSLAGPLVSILTLILMVILFKLLPALRDTIDSAYTYRLLVKSLSVLIYLEIWVSLLNLLPIPPLDGFGTIEPWLPAEVRRKAREFGNAGFAIILLLFWLPEPFTFLPDFIHFVAGVICYIAGVDFYDIRSGMQTISKNAWPLLAVILGGWIISSKTAPPEGKADKLLKKRKYADALALYDQALAKKEDPKVLSSSAACLLSLGRKQEALERAAKAVSIDPDNAHAQVIKSLSLAEVGNLQEALEAAETAIKCNDNSSAYTYPLYMKASVQYRSDLFEQALETIDKYLEREPNNVDGLLLKANCLENLGCYDEALAIYDKAARTRTGNARAVLGKGMLLCALGKTEQGIAEFSKVLPSDPKARKAESDVLVQLLNEGASTWDRRGKHELANDMRCAAEQLACI